jgi:hypothetical protein
MSADATFGATSLSRVFCHMKSRTTRTSYVLRSCHPQTPLKYATPVLEKKKGITSGLGQSLTCSGVWTLRAMLTTAPPVILAVYGRDVLDSRQAGGELRAENVRISHLRHVQSSTLDHTNIP